MCNPMNSQLPYITCKRRSLTNNRSIERLKRGVCRKIGEIPRSSRVSHGRRTIERLNEGDRFVPSGDPILAQVRLLKAIYLNIDITVFKREGSSNLNFCSTHTHPSHSVRRSTLTIHWEEDQTAREMTVHSPSFL